MICWWRIRNNFKKPSASNLTELKDILKNNIFGVDKHKEAVRLAFFSLSLVLLDELSPKEIWENLKFDNLLENNLISKDFFELINNNFFSNKFDLIIGNPPFISKLTSQAKKIEKEKSKKRPKLPDNQIALLFLEQGMGLCKDKGILSLIMPAGALLYNNNSYEFRKYFFGKFNLRQIIDFTPLSGFLFQSANVSTAAVFIENKPSEKKDILHLTVRRTKPTKEKIYFESDYYDFHKISYKDAMGNRLIWKANLLGGGRLKHIASRFQKVRSLNDYLEEKKNKGWKFAEGYTANNKIEHKLNKLKANKNDNEFEKLQKKYKTPDYLLNKPTIHPNDFTEDGIDNDEIKILASRYLRRSVKENKEIFKPPHLLIKKVVGKKSIPIEFREDYLSFSNDFIGIYAPNNQANELKEIEKRIKNNRNYLFYAAIFSGYYMVGRATAILKKDILALPYPERKEDVELSETEQIIADDFLNCLLNFHKTGENSKAEKPATDKNLKLFSSTYCNLLNTVYNKFYPLKPIKTNSFICIPFYHRKKPKIAEYNDKQLENYLQNLISNNSYGSNINIVKILRLYEKNIIYIIKTKQRRYWLRSVAIRDADETFSDLIKQGY